MQVSRTLRRPQIPDKGVRWGRVLEGEIKSDNELHTHNMVMDLLPRVKKTTDAAEAQHQSEHTQHAEREDSKSPPSSYQENSTMLPAAAVQSGGLHKGSGWTVKSELLRCMLRHTNVTKASLDYPFCGSGTKGASAVP